MVCAFTESFPSTNYSTLLFKMDVNGNVVWSRAVEGETINWPEEMITTSDGSFLLTGYAANALTVGQDIEAIKFDSAGAI